MSYKVRFKVMLAAMLAIFFITSVKAQDGYDSLPPYRKDSSLPNFLLLRQDSSWLSVAQTPKKTAVVITFFNPDCDHCQHEATRLAASMDKLKKIDFIWATYAASFEEINDFAKKYHLNDLPNVHFVKDVNYSIPSFYHLEMTPYMAVYNKKRQLVKTFPTGVGPDELLKLLE